MKYNTAEDRNLFAAQDGEDAIAGVEAFSHARVLRTLGHALESHRVVNCDIAVENGVYTIKGLVSPAKNVRRGLFQAVRTFFSKDGQTARADVITNRILLRFSMADIRKIDAQVRHRRSATPEVPDPLSMSQLLRVIGGFMDKRSGEQLLGLWIDDRWVTINHISRDKQLLKTTHDIEYFYDLWVKMYLQRSDRAIINPPSGPTVCITTSGRFGLNASSLR
jgi:hypothetical protein